MPPDNLYTHPDVNLKCIHYGFFTNEYGQSDAGYLLRGQKTRNVNLYSSEQKPESMGYDATDRVLANIQQCFTELAEEVVPTKKLHKFFMTTYYANQGKSPPLIISCDNITTLHELQKQAAENLDYDGSDTANPKRLGIEPHMRQAIKGSDLSIIRADALIFKGLADEQIAVLGASGDAHPIMMFDDEQKIACYIAGAHTSLKQGVLERSVEQMIAMGAQKERIQVVIGPGLGPRSYEFGDNAPDYFAIQDPKVLKPVIDHEGKAKYLIDIYQLVTKKLTGIIPTNQIHDIEIDTMGFDLYDAVEGQLKRKLAIDFEQLNETGLLFFSARRTIMNRTQDLTKHNPAAHNTVGRHGAGFSI